ncbi:MAG: (4Fe-4S)-binding protein [Thermincola sp.]|jgi:benzoyl-CoA reductase subunit BamC|nr:(4Fe-4S)-binding protein [Thermincola sp.]MDT3702475.1 (4Fe-4S)-binding protein [Thermincola sp.]
MACSGFHAKPQFGSFNPARSRIRVVMDMLNDEYVPVRATDYAKAACAGRPTYMINGKEYSECSFCGNVCPIRDLFKEPDSGLPLKCDMCAGEELPLCVQVCRREALTYEEIDEVQEEVKADDMETGIKALIDKFGPQKVSDTFNRMTKKD